MDQSRQGRLKIPQGRQSWAFQALVNADTQDYVLGLHGSILEL